MATYRVYREPDSWLVIPTAENATRPSREASARHPDLLLDSMAGSYPDLDSMAEELSSRLAVMLVAPVGWRQQNIGRRISDTVFWVFTGE